MKLHCAVLDDYQDAALQMADWTSISDRVEVTRFRDHFESEDQLVDAIGHCDIVVIMRERTPFPAPVFDRLPQLKLLITTGMRNSAIDLQAAASYGVTVCGTASKSEPPTELAWALILGLGVRDGATATSSRVTCATERDRHATSRLRVTG